MSACWLWLPEKQYPNDQYTKFDALSEPPLDTYVVAEFTRSYTFVKPISSVSVSFSADTEVQLFCNQRLIATGPAAVGGDFLGNGKARQWYYFNQTEFAEPGNKLAFFSRVKMGPARIYEYSMGHGGFWLSAKVTFSDGQVENIGTDATWLVRKNGAYVKPCEYDGRISPDPFVAAEPILDRWQPKPAPIPVRDEKVLSVGEIQLEPGEEITEKFQLDRIYAGFLQLASRGKGNISISLQLRETDEAVGEGEELILHGEDAYRGFYLHSIGNITASFRNESDEKALVKLDVVTTCYPVRMDAHTETSDPDLNEILEVCKHTLQYCRQTHHLDSPRHCEPLACTGDYYIESLMTVFSFGDLRLAEFDVERTAELLRHNDGRMFHTTYSLIWVRMLYDVYLFRGDPDLLKRCRDALELLLNRFAGYLGANGLVENPPDYMFVDWIYIDGLSMHHPPKALGQTVLNMFYFMALSYAQKIYEVLGDPEVSGYLCDRKEKLRNAINTLLYDPEKEMYFEGLNTHIPPEQVYQWQPQNVEKRYYLKHSNILAAYTSVCDGNRARALLEKIMNEEIEGNVQPYFQHYLMEAVYEHGLAEKYTLSLVNRCKAAVAECPKGLVEGFYPPEPTYSFDHSHAWGGTPLYSLPRALTGLTMEEPGFRRIRLKPALLGLAYANVEIPTPFGMVRCELRQGQPPKITAPEEVTVVTE